ncbi:MAG TPA: CBS domain-containing protein [Phycisphaerales bacterium]|nr:CBS domain-containing protein [Phycisphaerales bacterium]
MLVKEIMTSGIETVDSSATYAEAARKMRALDVGSLPVQEESNIVGIVTRRDIVFRGIAQGLDPKVTFVNEIMTSELACCSENESIDEAAHIMERRHIHRLVVLNGENQPVGMLSLSDLAVKARNEHLSWEVLEQLSEPSCPKR